MRRCTGVLALGMVVLAPLACEREAVVSPKKVENAEKEVKEAKPSSHEGVEAPQPAKAAGEEKTPARCFTEVEVADYDPMGYRLRGTFNVIRVARDDSLALRSAPSPEAPVLEDLAHDSGGLTPTRSVCVIGSSYWWEMSVAGKVGWVNSRFVGRLTEPHEASEKYRERAGKTSAPSPWGVVTNVLKVMNEPPRDDGHYEASLLDIKVSGNQASARIYACCELDDSIDGEQAELFLKREEDGWHFERASTRYLCGRGLSEDRRLCI